MKISTIRRHLVHNRAGQRGQALLIFGLAFIFLMGIVGLATDGAYAYFNSISIERAAAAAALAGVPYMPKNFASVASKQDATDRALAEAGRNGYVNGATLNGCTVVVTPQKTGQDNELSVSIKSCTPTFFMNALGFARFPVQRIAVAGYKPPIALGQPGNQSGSETSALGTGSRFYFDRYKGWNNVRSEGDAFTPNPDESVTGGGTGRSTDLHTFSQKNGIESASVDCNSGGVTAMPCRGGYNYRIVVPDGQMAEIQVYNAAYAPDFGTNKNVCDNRTPLYTSCNPNGYYYHEDDSGGACATSGANPCTTAQQNQYPATAYSLFDVPNTFLRSADTLLTQNVVYPIDATNWDGKQGGTGAGSAGSPNNSQPSYINVNRQNIVKQYYTGSNPCNMLIYRSWIDIANYDGNQTCAGGTGDNVGGNNLVARRDVVGCGKPCNYNTDSVTTSHLGPGVYRLRVDALSHDGSFNAGTAGDAGVATAPFSASASKGYAVRVIPPPGVAGATCTKCTVSGWEDMCIYTPLASGTGVNAGIVPLFELTKDYAGATIDVDVFDVGDAGGTVDLSIIDPTTGVVYDQGGSGTLPEVNDGISRLGPMVQHTGNQGPAPRIGVGLQIDNGPNFTATQAGYRAADTLNAQWYQGTWIRISIPIPTTYSPSAYPNDFWKLKYENSGGADDTFTFTVSARGGPVHLLTS